LQFKIQINPKASHLPLTIDQDMLTQALLLVAQAQEEGYTVNAQADGSSGDTSGYLGDVSEPSSKSPHEQRYQDRQSMASVSSCGGDVIYAKPCKLRHFKTFYSCLIMIKITIDD
jgi:hypothetical protein